MPRYQVLLFDKQHRRRKPLEIESFTARMAAEAAANEELGDRGYHQDLRAEVQEVGIDVIKFQFFTKHSSAPRRKRAKRFASAE